MHVLRQPLHSLALLTGQRVGIEIQRRARGAVPQQRAHSLDVCAQLQQARREAVPQRMKMYARDFRARRQPLKAPLHRSGIRGLCPFSKDVLRGALHALFAQLLQQFLRNRQKPP